MITAKAFFKLIKNNKGISIVELLICAVAIVFLGAMGLQYYVHANQTSYIQAEVSDAQQAATFCLNEITKAVRNAGYKAAGKTYLKNLGTLGHDTLIIYSFNEGTGTIDSTRFYLNHTVAPAPAHPQLMRKVNNTAAVIFAEDIEDIDFLPNVAFPNTLTVSLTARTAKIDPHLKDYRRRTVSSDIVMPNAS